MKDKDFPYNVSIRHDVWTIQLRAWLLMNVGIDNFKYDRPANAYTSLRYAFRNAEDAAAFKLRFA